MRIREISLTEGLLLTLAGTLSAAITAVGLPALYVFGGRMRHVTDSVALAIPFLAFPVFCVSFLNRKAGLFAFAAYFALERVLMFLLSLPQIDLNPAGSLLDKAQLAVIVLLALAYIVHARALARLF